MFMFLRTSSLTFVSMLLIIIIQEREEVLLQVVTIQLLNSIVMSIFACNDIYLYNIIFGSSKFK